DRRLAVSPLGARCLSSRSDSERCFYRFRFKSRVVRCARKNRAHRLRTGPWQRRLARDDCRLVACPCSGGCVLDLAWQFRGAGANECSSLARLLRRRAWWLYFARRRCRRSRRIFRDLVLHHHLRGHAHRRVRGRRRGPSRNWRRRPAKFLRIGRSVALPCRLYGDLFLIARWLAAIGGFLWKILLVPPRVALRSTLAFSLAW